MGVLDFLTNPIDVPGPWDLPAPSSAIPNPLNVPSMAHGIAQNLANVGESIGVLPGVPALPNAPTAGAATPSNLPASPDQLNTTLTNIAAQLGVDVAPYLSQIDIQRQLYDATKTADSEPFNPAQYAQSLVAQMQQDAQQQRAQFLAEVQQARQNASDQKFALALQQQTGQFFEPFIQNILKGGETSAAALNSLAGTAPAGFRGVFEAQAQQALAGAQRLAGAYGMQAALSPMTYMQGLAAQRQQSELELAYKQAQIQNLQAQTAYQNFLASGGGGSSSGSSDFKSTIERLKAGE